MGMDPSGNIRALKKGEQARPGEVILTAAEAKSLRRQRPKERHEHLNKIRARRTTTAAKREEQRKRAREHGA